MDNRPKAHYPGDVRGAVGQIIGPTLHGEILAIDEVDYDPVADRSTARFRYATAGEVAASTVRR